MKTPYHMIITAAALTLAASPAGAQNPGRVLNGHRFIPSGVIHAPFITTFVRTGTGAGAAFNVKTPFIGLQGDTLGVLEGDVGFITLEFEFQQQLAGWLALWGGFNASARVGVDDQSALAQGFSGIGGVSLGATARAWHNNEWLFSVSLDVGTRELVGLAPFQFAQTIIDSGGLTKENNLVRSGTAIGAVVAPRMAWAPRNWLGFTGFLELGMADVENVSTNEVIYGAGLKADIDFRNLGWWSLGLTGFVTGESFTPRGSDVADQTVRVGLGVFYTGREDFSIGLEGFSTQLRDRQGKDRFSGAFLSFNLLYWFSGG